MTLFLEATVSNWGLMGPGSWNHTTWQVFSDGSYTVSEEFNPTGGRRDAAPVVKARAGAMEPEAFERLVRAAGRKWHTGEVPPVIFDGAAWEFRLFDPAGKTLQHWKTNYIKGHSVMEGIRAALPPLTEDDTGDR